jgi:hypothetical protein
MNDLIGLRYGWGHRPSDGSGLTDCFQLCCEVRRRLGLRDYSETFEWVYGRYTDETFPRRLVMRWLNQHGRPATESRPGTVLCMPGGDDGIALGTCTDFGVIFIAFGQNVVHAPVPTGLARCFWMDD